MINPLRSTFAAVAIGGLLFSAASAAFAGPKDYQFTGPIISMTDTTIVVQKGKENWEFAKDAATKLPADAKVGDKVTVHYIMNAMSVEANTGRPKNPPKDRAKPTKANAAPVDAATATPAATPTPKP